jgi:hypothetical protein
MLGIARWIGGDPGCLTGSVSCLARLSGAALTSLSVTGSGIDAGAVGGSIEVVTAVAVDDGVVTTGWKPPRWVAATSNTATPATSRSGPIQPIRPPRRLIE